MPDRTTPLSSSAAPMQRAAFTRKVTASPRKVTQQRSPASPLRGSAPKPRGISDDPEWPAARLVALDRDLGACRRCGHRATDVHHRFLLGAGGSDDPDRHRPDRLISLCRACHTWAHEHRNEAKALGWIVPRTTDPATIPTIPVHTITGPVYLTARGTTEAAA